MTTIARLNVLLGADASELDNALTGIQGRLQTFGQGMAAFGTQMMTRVTLPLAAVGTAAFKMASDAEEAADKFNLLFGPAADSARMALEELTAFAPMTRGEMQGLAADLQALLLPMGFTREEAGAMSTELLALGVDLASLNNTSAEEAIRAIGSALRGESEPLSRFGVDTRVLALQQTALAEGLIESTDEFDRNTQAMSVLQQIYRQAPDAIGNARDTMDSSANSTKLLWKEIRQLAEDIGEKLVPILTPLIQRAREVVHWVGTLSPTTQEWIVKVGLLVAAIGPLAVVVGTLITLLSGPAGIVAAISVGVVVAIQGLIGWVGRIKEGWALWMEQVQRARAIWATASAQISEFAAAVGQMIRAMVDSVVGYFTNLRDRVFGAVGSMVEGVQNFFAGMADVLVGHSIVPDMVDAVIDEFTRMGDDAQGTTRGWLDGMLSDVDGWASKFLGTFGSIGSRLGGIFESMGGVSGILDGLLGGPIGGVVTGMVTDFLGDVFGGDDKQALAEIDAWQENFADRVERGRDSIDDLTGDLLETVNRFMTAEDFTLAGRARATSAIGTALESGGVGAVVEALRNFPRLFQEFGDEFQSLADRAASPMGVPEMDSSTLITSGMTDTRFTGGRALDYLSHLPDIAESNRAIARSLVTTFPGEPVFAELNRQLGQEVGRETLVAGDFGA